MPERSNGLVLKTSKGHTFGGSNPSSSAKDDKLKTEETFKTDSQLQRSLSWVVVNVSTTYHL
jgi:hypothetical protein